jgi:hypothetical protein
MPGKSTSDTEVTHISSHGIWLLSDGNEYFLAFDDFPWFRDASISQIHNVETPSAGHFYWPDLDVDLSLASIQNPKKHPLTAK